MSLGFSMALDEITLVLFTTLAPTGAMACVIMAAVLVFSPLGESERTRVNRALCIPLIVAMVGLIASATHLGSPANALYVLLGVGRSPLSNEVFCAGLFLASCGLYWLFCFTEKQYVRAQKVWCAAIALAGLVCIGAIAMAYDASTIVTWNTWYVPLNVWFSAFAGGPLLAMLGLRAARAVCLHTKASGALVAGSLIALVANVVCLVMQNASLGGIWNGYGTALDLVPMYPAMIAWYAAMGLAAIGCAAWPLRGRDLPSVVRLTLCCALFFAGLFVVRFGFYMMHMTYGLGV